MRGFIGWEFEGTGRDSFCPLGDEVPLGEAAAVLREPVTAVAS